MTLEYYNNYLDNIYETPVESIRSTQQAYLYSQWRISPLFNIVEEAQSDGISTFENIEVWKNTVSQFYTNTIKDEKDYRRLMFKEYNHSTSRGKYYRFDDNYWITYEESNVIGAYNEILVKRCNNTMRWIDKNNGAILSMPCVVDGDISSTNPKKNKDIIVADATLTLMVQKNSLTREIKKNQRFIFNGDAYKFISYNAQMQGDYIDEDVPLLFMDLELDTIINDDDIENNIANYNEYRYDIQAYSDTSYQVKSFNGKCWASVTLNGEIVNRDVVWSSNEFATIDQQGNYVLTGDVGDMVEITAKVEGNVDLYSKVNITITDVAYDNYELIVNPFYYQVKQGHSITFEVNLYKGGVKQDDLVVYTASGADPSCYNLRRENNVFTLECLNISTTHLRLYFSSEFASTPQVMSIMLKPMFGE